MPVKSKYGFQFWLNIIGLISILFSVIFYIIRAETKYTKLDNNDIKAFEMLKENNAILKENKELWDGQLYHNGKVEQYMEDN